ncbi:nuclear pore complex protein Nup155-like [Styela clava]
MATATKNPLKEEVQDAANFVQTFLAADREQLDLSELISATGISSGSSSGTHDEDYPNLRLPQLTDIRNKPLPPELVEQFAHMQCNCIVGIFPEIGRAWLTVDSDIFVWRYADGEDLAYFDGLSETILSVALVKPKPGIFRDHIKYLLVLTTPMEIVILGVSFAEEDVNGEMHLLPDPLFTLTSDNVYLVHTVCTETGRIFTGGKDGCLYEIAYQAAGGWFARKCTKINHSRSKLSFLLPTLVNSWLTDDDSISQIVVDDTRHILYTRSEKGTITVYDLGVDGSSTTCVAQMKMDSIRLRASAIASTVAPSNFDQIIHIATISKRESRNIHLVAVSRSGVRMYFMTTAPAPISPPPATNINGTPIQTPSTNIANRRPHTLELVHVRLPPGYTASNTNHPMDVHTAHHNAGTLLLASSHADNDSIWCISRDSFMFEKILTETQISMPIDSRPWVIVEVPEPPSPLSVACLPFGSTEIPPDPPIQVLQHFQKPSEYVVITAQGCHMFNKLRPVDQLRFLLETRQDPESEAVANFFKLHRNGEASVACIILAMSGMAADRMLIELAVAAFHRHSGDAFYRYLDQNQGPSTLGQNLPTPHSPYGGHQAAMSPIPGQRLQDLSVRSPGGLPVISTPMPGVTAPNLTFQTMQSPRISSQATNTAVPAGVTSELSYSDKFKGLYKMFCRIVRPIWEGRLIVDYVVTQDNRQHTLNINRTEVEILSHILSDLNSFKHFMEAHCLSRLPLSGGPAMLPQQRFDSSGLHGQSLMQNALRAQQVQAAHGEAKLIYALYTLTEHTTQVLGLWRFMCDHEMHLICKTISKETLAMLKNVTFQDFVLDGHQLCSEMISVIVNRYIDDNSEVDSLNAQLRQICPSLYSLDDVICSRSSELLNSARQTAGSDQATKLEESLSLFQRVAHCVNLSLVSQQFQAVGFYTGVVELCATAAMKRDERNLALHFYKSCAEPEENVEGRIAYEARAECYKVITDMMDDLMLASESQPQAPSVPVQLGPPAPNKQGVTKSTQNLQAEEAQRYAESCMHLIMRSEDELLHVTIYDWMLRKSLADRLLRISSPYLEQYLKRVTSNHPDDPFYCDILWKYYERSGDHAAAAKILMKLADKSGNSHDLTRRVEYLSRAKMNGKSATTITTASEGGQLLHDLEEKLEVAQLQMQILQTLEELGQTEAVAALNSQLMDITRLYSDYAEPFQLAECKLAIVHCAGHYDPSLIDALWQNILDQEIAKVQDQINENIVTALSMKLSQLGRKYNSAMRYFPVEFLVNYLEKVSCQNDWPEGWVFTSLLDAGVEITHLLELYQSVHRQKLPYWSDSGRPYHILRVIRRILAAFAENPSQYVPAPQRRKFVTNALDIIAVALVELQSTVQSSDHLNDTKTRFKNLQAQMERLETQVARRY